MTNLGQNALFVDDDHSRGVKVLSVFPAILWVKTAQDAISSLKSRDFSTVFLDFDLEGEEKGTDFKNPLCGMEVVRWVQENRPRVDEFVIVSHNQPAAAQMVLELQSASYTTSYQPFGRTKWWTEHLR